MKPSKNLIYRILTGFFFVCTLLGGILYSQYSFALVLCFAEILALVEFCQLINQFPAVRINKYLAALGGLLLFAGTFVFFKTNAHSLVAFTPYILYILGLFIWQLYARRDNPISQLAYSLLGQAYIVLPFSLLNVLAYGYAETGYHYAYLLALFVFIWVNDSFAYVFGVTLGRHRLFERISPKKSWEGFIGGAVCTVLASCIFSFYFDRLSFAGWAGFACIVVVLGTFGDLIESLLKRTLNVKDSGKILPGHGGMLDRFDSMIFAIPALVVYITLMH